MDERLTFWNIGSNLAVWAARSPGSDFSHLKAQRIIRKYIKRMNKLRRRDPDIDAKRRIAKPITSFLIKLLN
jgi:hypothetical protein